uniref:KIND domain-containing protein n=1 Tax=Oncorhynchus mykiss TaxID=8022 RepID=A0A8C7QR12_ONCMY
MSSTFVTLAEVLECRGGPLLEDEVWSLLLGTAESLVDVSYKGTVILLIIISPTSLLLSATGTLAFKNCTLSDEACTFTAPEMLQGLSHSNLSDFYQMLVYSLGMTLYWSVDYHLPQNQPVQLSDHLNSLLLSMCEDLAHRRVNLNSILESCESQHKASLLPPPNRVIGQLVEDVFHKAVSVCWGWRGGSVWVCLSVCVMLQFYQWNAFLSGGPWLCARALCPAEWEESDGQREASW